MKAPVLRGIYNNFFVHSIILAVVKAPVLRGIYNTYPKFSNFAFVVKAPVLRGIYNITYYFTMSSIVVKAPVLSGIYNRYRRDEKKGLPSRIAKAALDVRIGKKGFKVRSRVVMSEPARMVAVTLFTFPVLKIAVASTKTVSLDHEVDFG